MNWRIRFFMRHYRRLRSRGEVQGHPCYTTQKDTTRSAMRRRQATHCPAESTVAVLGGRWKVVIVWHLLAGTRRFSDLRRALPACTPKMLTQQLRELEADGVVRRKVYP